MATKAPTAPKPQWAFRSRLRRSAFGWRGSKPAIARIEEALAEIRAAARHDPAHAAEGAVLLLEKLSPAVREVDSSSGALGSAANRAVEALVPIIAAASVADAVRAKWLERLFEAIQEDDPPYITPDLRAQHDELHKWLFRMSFNRIVLWTYTLDSCKQAQ